MDDTIRTLLAVAKLRTPQEVEQFDACLEQLDPASLTKEKVSQLLGAFDDNVEHIEVAWGLLHFVEKVPIDIYLAALLECASTLYNSAPEWLETMIVRCVNSTLYRTALAQAATAADSECRAAIVNVLRAIQNNAPAKARASAEQCLVDP
jgi:hypothetical protein